MIPLWIIGGGGHARSVIDTARCTGRYNVMGILDDRFGQETPGIDGVPVRGPITADAVRTNGVENAVIAIGANQARAAVAHRLDGFVNWVTLVHPMAYMASNISVGEGSVVLAMCVIQPGASVGRHVILNTASTVDHDSAIGDYVHMAPGVHLAAHVSVGAGTLVGVGSCAIPGSSIGEWSIVGAGAAVVDEFSDNVTVVGVPARVITKRASPE